MKTINIDQIDLHNSFFHFSSKENLEIIKEEGLKAAIGDASKVVGEKFPRVYLSKGGKGILEIKNSFIHTFKQTRICDIPESYRKYFILIDFFSKERIPLVVLYNALERKFKDEIYFKVDAVEGEDYDAKDFLPEELTNEIKTDNPFGDVKGKANHDITPDKLSILTTDRGGSAFDIVYYLYNRLLEKAKKSDLVDAIKEVLSDLNGFFEYLYQRDLEIEKMIESYSFPNKEDNLKSAYKR